MPRIQLNVVLGLIVLALGIAVWFSREKEEKGPPLTQLAPETITSITLEHPDAKKIRLEKQDDEWRLVEPVTGRVDGFEINGVLRLADLETKHSLDVAAASLQELSLEPPEYSVVLNDTRLDFGGVEPLSYRRYVRSGDRIYLVEDPPSAALDENWADLISKSLLAEDAEVERIEVPGLTVARATDGGWKATPAQDATPETVQKFIDAWKKARSMWNELPEQAPKTRETVTIQLKDGERRFLIAERKPQFKLYSPEQQIHYVLSQALTEELLRLPDPAPADPDSDAEEKAASQDDKPVNPEEPDGDEGR